MFAKTIVLSDAFLDMPLSARCLYFTLGMFADDDGFVNSPKGIMRQCGASEDDMKVLLTKKFLLAFESGVIVIKHWRINNYLRSDRYQETKYVNEKSELLIDENGAYKFGIPNSGIPSIGKDSIGKDSIGKDIVVFAETAKAIIAYLNMSVGTNYKHNTKNTQKHIKARLTEGYVLEDFETVIDKKCAEWKGTEMEKYLRPETLFGNKFEGYLNQTIVTTQGKQPSSKKINWDDV
jgi:uncharacterized phage protein (TIGR02220 family)